MWYGILLLHVGLGLLMAAHGAQKLFGWFGGDGIAGTAQGFAALRFRPAVPMAIMAGLSELGGGLLLALGLVTPLAAFAVVVVMLNAIATVSWRNGFFNMDGGCEFNLLIIVAALTLAATSAGRFSLDGAIGWTDDISGLWWAVGVLASALVASGLTLTLGRARAAEPQSA